MVRSLILITLLIVTSCTAHAFVYFSDLITGLTISHAVGDLILDSPAIGLSNYFLSVRANLFAAFFLYVFNVRSILGQIVLQLT